MSFNFSKTGPGCFSWLFNRRDEENDPKSTVPGLTPKPMMKVTGAREPAISGIMLNMKKKKKVSYTQTPNTIVSTRINPNKSDVLTLGSSFETINSTGDRVRSNNDFELSDNLLSFQESPIKQHRQEHIVSDLGYSI